MVDLRGGGIGKRVGSQVGGSGIGYTLPGCLKLNALGSHEYDLWLHCWGARGVRDGDGICINIREEAAAAVMVIFWPQQRGFLHRRCR